MKRYVILCILLSATLFAYSQTMMVESFRLLENDLTANTYGTMERDQNGDVAALIKVVTLEKGFVFDGGMLGIVKTVQKAGEIWVYVPYGLQRITIAHPDFGVLRDYYFPITIDKARSYELMLNVVRTEREIQEVDVTANVNVTFENAMYTSEIYLNGIRLARGSWKGSIAATTYLIEVREKGYKTYSTVVTFSPEEQNRVIELPQLELITGTISVTSEPEGAKVIMDGISKGSTPLMIENVHLGVHDVELRQKGYFPYKTTISFTDDQTFQKIDATLEERIFLLKNGLYVGASYQKGNITGIDLHAGFYLRNINLEVGLIETPSVSKGTVYWVTPSESWQGSSIQLDYCYYPARIIKGNIGYGLTMKGNWRLTPQLGIALYSIKGERISVNDEYADQMSYTLSGSATIRLEYSPVRHISLMIAPSYSFPVVKGDLASYLDDNTGYIRQWCRGISVNVGVDLYF